MENLTEYKIKLPTLPDYLELVGYELPKKGDHYLLRGTWNSVAQFDFTQDRCLVARRRETLADWANKQRLFLALVEIFRNRLGKQLKHNEDREWIFDAELMQRQTVYLESPPDNLTGKLRLEAGKWVDA